ncbi:hypothetical protein QYF50_06950 [Paenibacillus vini]|uniref:hypothetical protein n=1 Tax=Paenibacillus vini TaxID=1476024 RepID=UPI0025B69CCF|nr:hypothetical protein [Paenibacillus vini]MDN4067629.1 hypothetical protein [Paenibacillus vini]
MIEQLFNSLDETVKQSTLNDFRNFMSIHEGVTKWSIYSDYCIDDSSKLYNSATFTLIPYINAFDEVRATLKELAPKDLKKTKEVNQLFCEFIKSGYMFNLSILFKSGKEHVFHGIQKEAYFNSFDSLNDNLSEWIKNTPSMKDYYSKIIKKNNFMKQELARKTFNFKLLNNILLVGVPPTKRGKRTLSPQLSE